MNAVAESAPSRAPRAVSTDARSPERAGWLADAAVEALHVELALYPKPGLVSFIDSGSHVDMTAETFLRSIAALGGYFRAIAARGADLAPFALLEHLGIDAERRMLSATGGINTHRGAVFVLGLLCAAAGAAALSAAGLRRRLLDLWGADLLARVASDDRSHGQRAAQRHGLRGARAEAAAGFPVLFEHAVPALRGALSAGLDERRAHLQAFFVALAELDDTNLVHRAGLAGLRYARTRAKEFLAAGGAYAPDALARAEHIHHAFVARRLSPGGSADVLAAASWVVRVCG